MYCCNKTKASLSLLEQEEQPACSPLEERGLCFRLSRQVADLKADWQSLAPKENKFLQYEYLQALEAHPPKGMGFCYLIFYKDKEPVGLAYYQTYYLDMQGSVQKELDGEGLLGNLRKKLQQFFLRQAVFNVLICGNLTLTGEHGFYFKEGHGAKQLAWLQEATDRLQTELELSEQKKYQLQMFKDFVLEGDTEKTLAPILQAEGYHRYRIQPGMYMRLPAHWECFDDYLAEMSSKYRVRAKRAAKKGQELEWRALELEEILAQEKEIYELYKNISNNVDFNAYAFDEQYFSSLKRELGEDMELVACYLDGRLVAFYTAIFSGSTLEAHFLGLDHSLNRSHQLYLNILYALVRMGIYRGVEKIDFARTALEIKSSVGAVAQEFDCYLRHRNRISSELMKLVFDHLSPKEEWTPRSPFKDMSIVE
ncbi:GNAT family N-acetyltransferase [Saprospira sp. CCB-QB6]|uniref:GNAT family N-acetyltransferase n=1 Tax=Saprospira sp. CCB-QB6 TaxID=3023936 RepID=UPI0023491BED|nr:GNAT family N-acetyltransferase [Saprospira sp. CCB-QB6]WCL82488.1 GNAT family N-acetyltransferase [Saprospira sp. CCB-QB6]